jgi:hypothetical protein
MAEITPGAVDYHLKGTALRDDLAFDDMHKIIKRKNGK